MFTHFRSKFTPQCKSQHSQPASEMRLGTQIGGVRIKNPHRLLSGFYPEMTRMGHSGIEKQRNSKNFERSHVFILDKSLHIFF